MNLFHSYVKTSLTIDMIAIWMLIIYRCVIAMIESAIATLLPPQKKNLVLHNNEVIYNEYMNT